MISMLRLMSSCKAISKQYYFACSQRRISSFRSLQHLQKMNEASLRADYDGTGNFERNVSAELERLGFEGFEREVSPHIGGEGGELLKIDIAFIRDRVALVSERERGPASSKRED